MDFESKLVKGLDAALKTWSESPNAFSVARNGGAELTIRSSLLYELECKTGCIAFTEAGGKPQQVGCLGFGHCPVTCD